MTLPPAIMNDLLTVYLAGEASPETKRLIEEYASSHPEFTAKLMGAAAFSLPVSSTQPDVHLQALKQARQFVTLRSIFLGSAIFFTLVPFIQVFRNGHLYFSLMRDAPPLAIAAASIAGASWIACYVMHRGIRRAGL
jgi:hypothetical protein